MYSQTILIKNPSGLHARPATRLVILTKKYKSTIEIVHDNVVVDPKSILSLLSGELRPGTRVEVRAEGEDEELAVKEICEYIDALEE
ncbi:HPr family phosphocarrier protein [Clostridium sp. KNHs216]|jgi:Phosphotransferase System HPr (HPr) Family|uniref:HPr family phosphocarrier protein n=1 Tax=Eubacteriales TaxID=186802 RepID=UPI00056EDEB4|nr:HPr family phosphocarrier protein [Clostridium sp. KNHs216]MBE6831909.1 HPr family phosphocarrier protein [Oscillospiraceae bacterium]TQI68253.1 phosphocarrier protein [Clostridium sp. KNHs216]